jgi:hypothetical protein
MYPEDRVLVAVINRKRDLAYARDAHWYRIPQAKMPRGVHAEYLAFFLSRAFKEENGAIRYYAERRGLELTYRRDLLPAEAAHKRADDVYYKVALGSLQPKAPPIVNPTGRAISFIYTTWDRFLEAQTIRDLYSADDWFVDRVYYALERRGIHPLRVWDAERRELGSGAGLHILCQQGTIIASTDRESGTLFLDRTQSDDEVLNAILARIAQSGGPAMLNLPSEE